MTLVYIGPKPGVGQVMKVMKNDADNPLTTPNTDYHKFVFNSETGDLGYMDRIEAFTASATFLAYNYQHIVNSLGYNPYIDLRYDYNGANYWAEPSWRDLGSSASPRYRQTFAYNQIINGSRYLSLSQAQFIPIRLRMAVWQLNADFGGMNWSSGGTGTPGQRTVKIESGSSADFRIARPGYDANTAFGNQCIVAPELKPILVAKAGITTVPANSTVVIPLDSVFWGKDIYIDTQSSPIGTVRSLPYVGGPDATLIARTDGFNIILTAIGPGRDVTYVAFAEDDLGPSSGGNNPVIETNRAASTPYLRITRPGAVNPPRLADTLLDTRYPTLPIITYGSISSPLNAFGDWIYHTVNYPVALGYTPLVKVCASYIHNGVRRVNYPNVFIYSNGAIFDGALAVDIHSSHMVIRQSFLNNAFLVSSGITRSDLKLHYWVFGIPV